VSRSTARHAVLSAYAQWQRLDRDEELLLDYVLDVRERHAKGKTTTWRRGEVHQLLLQTMPLFAASDPDVIAGTPSALSAFLRYLDASGQLKGASLPQLLEELDRATPQFAARMADQGAWGSAKILETIAEVTGLDPHDELAGEHERVVLPPVVAEPEDEVRRLAADAVLVRRVAALQRFLGPTGRTVTARGALKIADARLVATECGDANLVAAKQAAGKALRTMDDLPGVTEAWIAALESGLVHVAGSRATRVPGPADALDRWRAIAASTLDSEWLEPGQVVQEDTLCAIENNEPLLLTMLYANEGPLRTAEFLETLADEVTVQWRELAQTYLDSYLRRLERLAVVVVDGSQASLTALGQWWLRTEVLPGFGLVAPLVGDLASVTASELIDALDGYPEAAGEAEIAGWIGHRGPSAAAGELAALLGGADPAYRSFALARLDDLSDEAVPAVRAALDDNAARPFARVWLLQQGVDVEAGYERDGDAERVFVDLMGMALLMGVPTHEVPEVDPEFVRDLWRVDSVLTRPVLEHYGEHGAKETRRSARKALHSLASAGR
jgi:hypothetical protein